MIYAIGEPGAPVRMFLDTSNIGDAETQLLSGEVLLEAGRVGEFVITSEGALAPKTITIDEAKAAKWLAAKSLRDARANGSCETPLGRVNCDESSRVNISGAVQMASIAQSAGIPFAIDWTMADDTVVEHDASAMIAMGVAVGEHVAACHAACAAIRAAINAAGTVAELDAIDITAGYPALGSPA